MARWMSIMDCLDWHDQWTHTKLLAFLHWGLQLGWARLSTTPCGHPAQALAFSCSRGRPKEDPSGP
eukprot:6320863-Prorocentrum_lima.AAC.1